MDERNTAKPKKANGQAARDSAWTPVPQFDCPTREKQCSNLHGHIEMSTDGGRDWEHQLRLSDELESRLAQCWGLCALLAPLALLALLVFLVRLALGALRQFRVGAKMLPHLPPFLAQRSKQPAHLGLILIWLARIPGRRIRWNNLSLPNGSSPTRSWASLTSNTSASWSA